MLDSPKVKTLLGQNRKFIQERKIDFESSDSNFEEVEKKKLIRNGEARVRGQINK